MQRDEFLEKLAPVDARRLFYDWNVWAREDQLPPQSKDWRFWLLMGGRGAGKTRAGSEWVRQLAGADTAPKRIALIGETLQSTLAVMVEGDSGLLAVHPDGERPKYEASKQRLIWPGGTIAQLFSAHRPDLLRGPQFHYAWCDELAKWPYPEACFDMLQFALRLGEVPQCTITTTPKPIALLKNLLKRTDLVVSRASTFANAANLSSDFLTAMKEQYDRSSLGRQELYGELLEAQKGALWSYDQLQTIGIEAGSLPSFEEIILAIDPCVTSHRGSDQCGLIVAARGVDGRGYVLDDATCHGLTPLEWAKRTVKTYHDYEVDLVVGEVNQGGELIEACLRQIDPHISYAPVFVRRGKWLRAAPISSLYERNLIRHVHRFEALEQEMIQFVPDHGGRAGAKSPDRLDALVMALTHLFIKPVKPPQLRRL